MPDPYGFRNGGGQDLLSVVDRIFVLNLPHRADRRKEMDVQLRRIGLSLSHPAVELFPAMRPIDKGGFPTIGTRGCFISHLAILEKIASSDYRAALILEDDVDFQADFGARMSRLAVALEKRPWDILYSVSDRPEADADGLIELSPDEGVLLAHFVIFSKSAAAMAVPYLARMLLRPPGDPNGGPMHVDGAYGWFRAHHPQFRTLSTDVALAVQRPTRTDIHDLKWFDRVPMVRSFANRLRLIMHKRKKQG